MRILYLLLLIISACPALLAEYPLPREASSISTTQWENGDKARQLMRLAVASDATWASIDHWSMTYTTQKLWRRPSIKKKTDTFSLAQPRWLKLNRSEDGRIDVTGFDGTKYWEKDHLSVNGLDRTMSATDCVETWTMEIPNFLSHTALRFASIGSEELEGIPCQVVALFDLDGLPIMTLWVDQSRYLILRGDFYTKGPSGWMISEYHYSDFRDEAGLVMPHTWQRTGQHPMKYSLDRLEINSEGSRPFWQSPHQTD